MPDLWMDVDANLAEVPVNVLPLTDDGDFKTWETGVAYNAAGMTLIWNFTTTAGATTQTAVTPTTGGNYDWAHQGNGMYTIEIPASGGASANNDTEGVGWFTGKADGVLPWRGPTIGFRAAALNNALIDGGASLSVDVADKTGFSLSAAGVDAILDEAITEPAGVFAWGGATLRNIISWLGALASNKISQTATLETVRNRADDATIATADLSNDGTTAVRDSFS